MSPTILEQSGVEPVRLPSGTGEHHHRPWRRSRFDCWQDRVPRTTWWSAPLLSSRCVVRPTSDTDPQTPAYRELNRIARGLQKQGEIPTELTQSSLVDHPSRLRFRSLNDQKSNCQQHFEYSFSRPTFLTIRPFELVNETEPEEKPYEPTWKCTKCGKPMQCLEFQLRPSWRVVFERLNHQADKDTQQWLWSLSELPALRDGVAELSVANQEPSTKNQEPSTKNQEQRSSKTKNQELRTKNSAAFDSS